MKISSIKINNHSYIVRPENVWGNPYTTCVRKIEQIEELGVIYIRVFSNENNNYTDFTKYSTEYITYSHDGIWRYSNEEK